MVIYGPIKQPKQTGIYNTVCSNTIAAEQTYIATQQIYFRLNRGYPASNTANQKPNEGGRRWRDGLTCICVFWCLKY